MLYRLSVKERDKNGKNVNFSFSNCLLTHAEVLCVSALNIFPTYSSILPMDTNLTLGWRFEEIQLRVNTGKIQGLTQ
jgi:hypothetical protein